MTLLDFYRQYPDEASCEAALRSFREHHGLFCSQCGGLRLSWNPSHKSWTCMDCKHEMQLRSGTVMQGSHLPVRDWFAAMFLLTATRRAISAKEIQRQLGRKRYQPVWEMVHKLRDVMGRRDSLLSAEARAWKPAQDFRPCHGRKQPVRYASCQKVQYAQNCRAYKDAGHRRF